VAVHIGRIAGMQATRRRRVGQRAEDARASRIGLSWQERCVLLHVEAAAQRLGLARLAALTRVVVGHRGHRPRVSNVVHKPVFTWLLCVDRRLDLLVGILVEANARSRARSLRRRWRVRLTKHIRAHEATVGWVAIVGIDAVVAGGVAAWTDHVPALLERAPVARRRPTWVRAERVGAHGTGAVPEDDALAALRCKVNDHRRGGRGIRAQHTRWISRGYRGRQRRRRPLWGRGWRL